MLEQLIDKCRSYRSFTPGVSVPDDLLRQWLRNAGRTASTRNLQVVRFKICTGEALKKLLPLTRWAGGLAGRKFPPAGHEPSVLLILCLDTDLGQGPAYFKDIGIAAQTILLSATEAGFGGCMIGAFDPETVRKEMSLGERYLPALVIALGKPDETVRIDDLPASGSTAYWRDEDDVHHVPKRSLEDLIL